MPSKLGGLKLAWEKESGGNIKKQQRKDALSAWHASTWEVQTQFINYKILNRCYWTSEQNDYRLKLRDDLWWLKQWHTCCMTMTWLKIDGIFYKWTVKFFLWLRIQSCGCQVLSYLWYIFIYLFIFISISFLPLFLFVFLFLCIYFWLYAGHLVYLYYHCL